MRTVLHLVNGEDYSGAERAQDLLALGLPACGWQVAFACLKTGRFLAARESRKSPAFAVSPWGVRALVESIRHHRCVLVHTHSPRAGLIGRAAATIAGVPMIHHLHGRTWSDRGGAVARLSAWSERRALRAATAVIVVRETLEPHARRIGVAAERIHVVANGVPASADPPRCSGPPHRLVTIGLFRPRKGLEVLLDAVACLRDEGRRVALQVIGDWHTPGYADRVHARIAELGLLDCVERAGFRRNPSMSLAERDAFVLPSTAAEGIPMSLLEAMAVGVPVVGSRVPGIEDAVRDGIDGLLAEPGDPVSLGHALGRLVDGEVDAAALATRAQRRQRAEFTDAGMARGVAAVYEALLSR